MNTISRPSTTVHARNFIDGTWQDARATFESVNPANRSDVVGIVPLSDAHDVDQAVAAAKRAYPAWRDLSWVKRAEIVDNRVDDGRHVVDLTLRVENQLGEVTAKGEATVQLRARDRFA